MSTSSLDPSSYNTLQLTRQGRTLTIALNRPDRYNAVDGVMHEELSRVFSAAQRDEESDCIVLTGNGKAFSGGGDIHWLKWAAEDQRRFEQIVVEAKQIIFSMLDVEKPIIAKVNGHATGLGATLALFCDVIFMAETAKIGDPHVAVGLVAGDGGAVIWPQLIGYARAKEFLMTGDLMSASQAAQIGLVNHAVPTDSLDAEVQKFADRLNTGALKAIRWTKVSVNIGLKQLTHSIMDACLAYEAMSNNTADHLEGLNAFAERRPAVFTGA